MHSSAAKRVQSPPPDKTNQNRNPFPQAIHFPVPIPFYESGLAERLKGSEFKRYVTLLRVANYDYGRREVKLSLEELEKLDGVSPRSAFTVHAKLQELGLIEIRKASRPYTIELIAPFFWPVSQDARLLQRSGNGKIQVVFSNKPYSPAEKRPQEPRKRIPSYKTEK